MPLGHLHPLVTDRIAGTANVLSARPAPLREIASGPWYDVWSLGNPTPDRTSMREPDVLTIHEIAALLRVGLESACTLAPNGEGTGFNVGGQRRFRRRDIEARIDHQTPLAHKGGER